MVSFPLWLKSDRTRRIVALVCFFLVELFILINLVLSSDHPTAALSWTTLSRGNVNVYVGLTTIRSCLDDVTDVCLSYPLNKIKDSWDGASSCSEAGGWVIASYAIVLAVTIAPIFLLLSCGCVRVPYPRTIGTTTSFAALVWSIVAVSRWFTGCHNGLDCGGGCNKKAGYSVALAILTIVLAFVGMVFYWWRALRPQIGGTPTQGNLVDSNMETSDGYAPTSPAGGQFGGYSGAAGNSNSGAYSMGMQALSNPQVQQWGVAAASNPQVQQFGVAAASNPQVQQWGAQQAQQSYGYGGYTK